MSLALSLLGCGFLPQPHFDTGLQSEQICDFSSPPADAAQIVGRVTSPGGTIPVAGAAVTVGEVSAFSGAAGCFELEVPSGAATLTVEKGRYEASQQLDAYASERLDLGAVTLDDGGVKMAVVYGKYDDVGELMGDLGIPFDVYTDPEALYGDAELLASYDAVFANCGSEHTIRNDSSYSSQELDNVRDWVLAGGTLYASDWEFELFEGAVPDAAVFADDPLKGAAGVITAQVLDRNVEAILGTDHAQISYDLTSWAVVEDVDQGTPLVIGEVDGTLRPLALMHWEGQGRTVFTTFHNENQMTDDMRTILFELILAL
jgi:hypothetical protein